MLKQELLAHSYVALVLMMAEILNKTAELTYKEKERIDEAFEIKSRIESYLFREHPEYLDFGDESAPEYETESMEQEQPDTTEPTETRESIGFGESIGNALKFAFFIAGFVVVSWLIKYAHEFL